MPAHVEVEQFYRKHPDARHARVRLGMASIIERATARGEFITLKQAYQSALRHRRRGKRGG